MTVISPPYDLPDLRPFRTIQHRMRLAGGAVVTENGVLESDTYVAGTSGWQIAGDGSAEFNNITARGDVVASSFSTSAETDQITNGTFESGTTGWTAGSNTTISQSSTQKHSGTYSLRAVRSATTGSISAYTEVSALLGRAYHARLWLRGDTASRTYTLTLEGYTVGSQVRFKTDRTVQVTAATWVEFELWLLAIPSTSVTKLRLTVSCTDATTTAGFYLDDVSLALLPEITTPYLSTDADDSGLYSYMTPDHIGFYDPDSDYRDERWGLHLDGSNSLQRLLRLRGPGGDSFSGGVNTKPCFIEMVDNSVLTMKGSGITIDAYTLGTLTLNGQLVVSDSEPSFGGYVAPTDFDLLHKSVIVQGAPAGNSDVTGAAFATWGPSTTVTIPAWATRAHVMVGITGVYGITSSSGITCRIQLDGVNGIQISETAETAPSTRHCMAWADTFTGFSTGSGKSLIVQALRSSGAGAMRADTASDFTYLVVFSA